MAVSCFHINSDAAAAVTAQPSSHHVEQAILLEMINPTMGVSLGDWPSPPRSECYYENRRSDCGSHRGSDSRRHTRGSGGVNNEFEHSFSQRHHRDTAAGTKQQLAVGMVPRTITRILRDCMGLIRDVKTKEPEERYDSCRGGGGGHISSSSSSSNNNCNRTNGSSSGDVVEKMKANKEASVRSDCSLVTAVQLLLGRAPESGRRVAFKPVPEIQYIDKCRQLFPPTLKGREMKREAFWSVRELEVNRLKWDGHLEAGEKGKDEYHSCECLGCLVDGEEAGFEWNTSTSKSASTGSGNSSSSISCPSSVNRHRQV